MSFKEALRIVRNKNKEARVRRGQNSEDEVDKALQILADRGFITTSWNATGSEDRNFGIDRHIQLTDGTIIDLQVKSSRSGVNKAKENFNYIPVIEVVENEKTENLAMRLFGRIQSKLSGKF